MVAITVNTTTSLYPTFQEITHLFPAENLRRIKIMPINGNSGEKLIFTETHETYKVSIYHLSPENKVTDITNNCGIESYDLQAISTFKVNNNKENPLVLFTYIGDYHNNAKNSKLFSWNGSQFIDISDTCGLDLNNVQSITFNSNPNAEVIALKYGIENSITKLFTRNEIHSFVEISDSVDLQNARIVSFDRNPRSSLMLVIYCSTTNKAPILANLSSSENHFLDLFGQHDFQAEWKSRGDSFVQSVNIMSNENKLYLYASWLDREFRQFFCIDRENESVNEISKTCSIPSDYLLHIKSIEFKNPLMQNIVGMHYHPCSHRIKLFSFSDGIFTDVSDELGIQDFNITMNRKNFIKIIQDDFGTILVAKNSDNYSWILYDPSITSHYEFAKRTKRALVN